jgi:hypothetical protein
MPPIDFRGYSGDCLIHGSLTVPSEVRLTDFLNTADVFPVTDASLYALEDGRAVPAGEQQLDPADLWAVEPTDSGVTPWHADLHISTRSVQVEIDLEPYQVTGYLHGVQTGDPLANVHRRRRMIPLTEATIRFKYAGHEMTRDTKVLIVNRERALGLKRLAHEHSKLDDLELPPPDPMARDLTGAITFDREGTQPQ